MSSVLEFVAFMGSLAFGAILLVFVVLAPIMWIGNHAAWPGHVAEIEQLRRDASHVDPQQAEDVIGQVTETNQWLAENKVGNTQWWIGWAIPDGIDDIELIEVPQ